MRTLKIKCAKIRANPDFRKNRPVACMLLHRGSWWILVDFHGNSGSQTSSEAPEWSWVLPRSLFIICLYFKPLRSPCGAYITLQSPKFGRNLLEIPKIFQTHQLWPEAPVNNSVTHCRSSKRKRIYRNSSKDFDSKCSDTILHYWFKTLFQDKRF